MNYEDFLEDPGEGFEKCCYLSPEEKEDRIDMLNELKEEGFKAKVVKR